MEYRKAKIEEAQIVCDIVQGTKAEIYPHFYTQAVVDFFGRLHSIDNITKDIENGKIDASLPAALFYEHRGYKTVEHKKHDIGDGEVMIYEIMRKDKNE